jgi:elongation factor P
MIQVGQIAKGMFIIMKNAPYLVVEREFVTPGKGQAFARIKLKNLINGSTLQETAKTNDEVDEADVSERNAQFMYMDDDWFHFMDNDNYDQFEVSRTGHDEKKYYLRENDNYKIIFWDANPIEIQIPLKMVFTVVEAPEALKGDTVSGATKTCRTETGLTVRCPIFIKENEKIRVNTETNEYVERVND